MVTLWELVILVEYGGFDCVALDKIGHDTCRIGEQPEYRRHIVNFL